MIYKYKDILERYKGNKYELNKDVEKGIIFKIEEGVYSYSKYSTELAIISKKYKDAVFTLESAFYYHGLSNYIPEKYVIATRKSAWGIKRKDIKQIFMKEEYYKIGIQKKLIDKVEIKIYDLERTLIELIRYGNKLPLEQYREVIRNYRDINQQLDYRKLSRYSKNFKSRNKIMKTIEDSIL